MLIQNQKTRDVEGFNKTPEELKDERFNYWEVLKELAGQLLSAITDYVRNCVGIKSPSRHSKDTLVGREILEAFKKGLEDEKITAVEVCDIWEMYPDVKFNNEDGRVIRLSEISKGKLKGYEGDNMKRDKILEKIEQRVQEYRAWEKKVEREIENSQRDLARINIVLADLKWFSELLDEENTND